MKPNEVKKILISLHSLEFGDIMNPFKNYSEEYKVALTEAIKYCDEREVIEEPKQEKVEVPEDMEVGFPPWGENWIRMKINKTLAYLRNLEKRLGGMER